MDQDCGKFVKDSGGISSDFNTEKQFLSEKIRAVAALEKASAIAI